MIKGTLWAPFPHWRLHDSGSYKNDFILSHSEGSQSESFWDSKMSHFETQNGVILRLKMESFWDFKWVILRLGNESEMKERTSLNESEKITFYRQLYAGPKNGIGSVRRTYRRPYHGSVRRMNRRPYHQLPTLIISEYSWRHDSTRENYPTIAFGQ